jgi:hypothetical protein
LNHNEALQQLDIFVGTAVEELPSAAPPVSTALGSTFIVGNSPGGEWAGKAECLATWTSGGWRFVAPYEGMTAYVKRTRSHATYRDGAWEFGVLSGSSVIIDEQQVIGPRSAPVASPSGGSAVDVEARSAIDQILNAMRQHGLIAT